MSSQTLSSLYAREFNIPQELACIVSNRFKTYEDARKFLCPELSQLHNPDTMPDIEQAVCKIANSLRMGEDILIYAHDDPDGFCSATILYYTLCDVRRGGKPEIFIYPINREKDGYVLNPEVLKAYKNRGAKVLITVDFGISNKENFRIASEMGLELIICDHHETNLTAFPVPAIDPKRPDSEYPFRELAGVGVTLKLCQSIYKQMFGLNCREFLKLKGDFLAITMIGTIADRVMPVNENRVFCYEGLKALTRLDKPWAKYFSVTKKISFPVIFAEIIPLLQSASLEDSNLGIEFFTTESDERFALIAEKLRTIEDNRKVTIDTMFQIAIAAAKVYTAFVISIIPDRAIPSSMQVKINNLGKITSKLRDHFHRTAIAILLKDNKCYGELRSHDIDLFSFLNDISSILTDFGGHKRAAGFSMCEKNLEKFISHAERNIRETPQKKKEQYIPEAIINKSQISILEPLLPFGEGNQSPLLTDGTEIYTIDNMLNIINLGLWQT